MAKKTSNIPLPKSNIDDHSIHLGSNKDMSSKGLASAIAIAMIPVIRSTNKTLVDSMSLMQSYLISELPDLGIVSGYLEDFAKDLFGKPEANNQTKVADEQAKDIKLIKKENIDHTSIFDMLADKLDDLILEVRDLSSINSAAWGVSKEQLAVIKVSNSIMREQEKFSKFNLQKQKHNNLFNLKNLNISESGSKTEHPLLKILGSLTVTKLIPLIESLIIGLVETFLGFGLIKSVLSKISPKAFTKAFAKITEIASKLINPPKKGLSGAFSKVAAGEGIVQAGKGLSNTPSKVAAGEGIVQAGKGLSKFSKVGSIGKTIFGGVGAIGIAAGAIGALQGAYQGYDEGKRGLDLAESTFRGFVDGFLEPFRKFLGLDFLNYDDITDVIAKWYVSIVTGITGAFESITATFTETIDKISNIFTSLKDLFLNNIRAALQKIIPEDNKISILGNDMKFAPEGLHEFAYPKSTVTPSPKQDQKTIDMISNQSKLEDAQMKYGTKKGDSNINSVVNNISPINNTIVSSPIITRNPEPLIFGGYLNI